MEINYLTELLEELDQDTEMYLYSGGIEFTDGEYSYSLEVLARHQDRHWSPLLYDWQELLYMYSDYSNNELSEMVSNNYYPKYIGLFRENDLINATEEFDDTIPDPKELASYFINSF